MTELPLELIDFSQYLADEARNISRRYFRSNIGVSIKDDKSPVTDADLEIETMIRKLVKNNFPDHAVYGEEFGPNESDAEYTWVIDPIDGTKSFIAGRPLFGTLIALVKEQKPILGIIDQPIISERWLGVNGKTLFNNREVSTRTNMNVREAIFSTTSPFLFNDAGKYIAGRVTDATAFTLYGGDCYAYGQLAMGCVDVIVESGLKPYDYCALIPVVTNAGGKITDWQGNDIDMRSGGNILACGDPVLHAKLLKEIF